ncbi:MAG TPA: glycosyltransferase [Vicinamibacterales bacterium]
MNILIANRRLTDYSGTEVVSRDLAIGLKALGHAPVVWAPRLGGIAREIRDAGIAVHGDVRAVGDVPDVIHGNHPKVLLESLLRFPGVPAVAVCHDGSSVRDEPFFHPRILRYVAVDERCRRRIERQAQIPRERIEVHLNAIDLGRFRPRAILPETPSTALVFSNYATTSTYLPALRRACRRAAIRLDVLGGDDSRQTPHPEAVLGRYDVVFAKARCALEAMAVGCAVVLCDFAGLGPLVTAAAFDDLRANNFGQAVLARPHTASGVLAELRRYDAADAARVSSRVREEAGWDRSLPRWVSLYEDVVREHARGGPAPGAEHAALLDYLQSWSYEARMDWERAQIAGLARVPLVGATLVPLAKYVLRQWSRKS